MKQKKLNEWGYKLFKSLLSPIFKFYYRPKIINKTVIPQDGPLIFAGNHKHLMDQCMVIIATKRVIHYMAKKEYFDGKFAWFFKAVGCISVNRKEHDQEAVALALDVLENNGAIGIFPEGTRNRTNQLLLPFKYGAVSLAAKTKATIVPFGIKGDYKFRSKNLTIYFGQPFKVENMPLEEANKKLESTISNLLQ